MFSLIAQSGSYLNRLYSGETAISGRQPSGTPLSEGDFAPEFTFSSKNWPGASVHADVTLKELHQKPLVVAFYSVFWNGTGISLLKQLQAVQTKIGDAANVLIVTSEAPRQFIRAIENHDLSFSFYYDSEKVLAEKFGIFSEDKPTWNLFSGINTNVPLLSAYVISPSGQISFSYIEDFSSPFPEGDLLAAANAETEIQQHK
ncbi:peroxiredoxin [Arcticibacter tournemirensis]|uniref:Redoxin domain-containing protein n=1 Tax=Arcticibacter tournemirensis TaxID=699437 RepID=A0A5M9GXL0_9SPHI|nr:redoxin domain-containing protein [Arcticibacter tournemirensis]KAA8478495.1 redoxin domain-containing protein [Arcticibacter tournemirensis]TQM51158.1 peroxiredoxin [Arcticibacter tournemirensis]